MGAGIIGLTIAREIRLRWPDQRVTVLEKEADVALHASGRNSGVLHAGFYYDPDSLKAKLTNSGNKQLTDFCIHHGIKINRCGKLVVASSEADLPALTELHRRGIANGVELQLVDEREAKDIEPRARTYEWAIYSPHTSAVDPVEVTQTMAKDCESLGVILIRGESFQTGKEWGPTVRVATSKRLLSTGLLINAAGLYADRVAHQFGVGRNYRMQPFKGLYLHANDSFGKLNTHVYPVPDLRNPFLGVHFTITVDGHVKIGPTATPALWREQYGWREGFNLGELSETTGNLIRLLTKRDSTIRRSAPAEAAKYLRQLLVKKASRLIPDITPHQFEQWGRPGIRAQLVDRTTMSLLSDFKIETTQHTLHILNAVSPAFTSSLPFASLAVDELTKLG